MKIRHIEVFQVQQAPEDKPPQRNAWVRIHSDDGSFSIGEASPIEGGFASFGIVKHNLALA
jgi:L-alanine-DL-glutamate epimerase-like enolase superfamily enzyme